MRLSLREIIGRSLGVFKLLTAAQFKAVLASPHLNTRYEEQVSKFGFWLLTLGSGRFTTL